MADEASTAVTMPSDVTGEGRPLVLVPGGLTGWLSWAPIAERLSADRRVVRVQLLAVQLGLDDQPLPPGYSRETERTALANTLGSLGLTPPVDFAAWSYGAAVTLEFAVDHPEWVRSLTLIEPPAFWVLPTLDAEGERLRDAQVGFPRDDVTEEDLARFVVDVGLVPPGRNPRELPQWPTMSRHRQSLRAVPSAWEDHGAGARLSELARPTLLVKGTGSSAVLHQVVEELAHRLPDAQVGEWPGGHAPHLVSTDAFLERMSAFQEGAEAREERT